MPLVNIICVGNMKDSFYRDAYKEYEKRMTYFQVNLFEIKESDMAKEGDAILARLSKDKGYTVALCVEGKELSSEDFAEELRTAAESSRRINFIIGGPTGLDPRVKAASDLRLSFSRMTMPHRLARVFLAEQIYRAETIILKKPYHK